ncbi:uncharacterized protein DUF2612 [Orbus hercynius]|uniref:Uncharacterized protein DUF2612 n=1 Tax=Orbus hercynius TaxID=593135 RepID=A0A495RHM0_9GAMM|nr:DUF2612 domain-containing protein [Orbus hercynius]RKS86921.1 uncharacterized protein DUF2612 [Orbus hercynius]
MSDNNDLIWQYRDKPNAVATINALTSETRSTLQSTLDIAELLNIDTAQGYALDLIGRHVGMSRILSKAIAKEYFGFLASEAAQGFNTGEFYRYGDALTASVRLNDDDYRFFIKAKTVKNYQDGTIENIINSVRFLCGNHSNAIDLLDMTMNIVVGSQSLNTIMLYAIKYLDILVRPVGVHYKLLILTNNQPFGFYRDKNAHGFGFGQFVRLQQIG